MSRSEKRQRTRLLAVRLTESEWQALRTRADVAGLSVAGYSRAAILKSPPLRASRRPPVVMTELSHVLAHVGKIGSNVNQLARLANLGGWPESADLREALADVRAMRTALLNALGVSPSKRKRTPHASESLTA
jgi:hypothetical protein